MKKYNAKGNILIWNITIFGTQRKFITDIVDILNTVRIIYFIICYHREIMGFIKRISGIYLLACISTSLLYNWKIY